MMLLVTLSASYGVIGFIASKITKLPLLVIVSLLFSAITIKIDVFFTLSADLFGF